MKTDRSPVFGALSNPSMVDFPGRLAAVLFTTGCNFRCGFCHNARLLGIRQEGYTWEELDRLCRRFKSNWVKGAVLTGGEPTLAGNLVETIEFLRVRGLPAKLDTNGSRPDVLRRVLPRVEYVAMDIKCRIENYPDFVAFEDIAAIRQSIRLLLSADIGCEFRTTVIEGVHTEEDLREIGAVVRGAKRYVLQAFVPREDLPEERLRKAPRTRPATLYRLAEVIGEYVEETIVRGD